jgi:NADH-quinone oxidoreductase subunit I
MRIYGSGILKSMRIAFRNFMRPPITVQYPHEKVELPERSRWAVALKLNDDGSHRCTACMACERACPDHIIRIDVTTSEDRSKLINHWHYEIGACMMCGLCVEACPFSAVEMSHAYELATTNPLDLNTELITDSPAAAPKRKEPVCAPGEKPATAQPVASASEAAAPSPAEEPAASEGEADV